MVISHQQSSICHWSRLFLNAASRSSLACHYALMMSQATADQLRQRYNAYIHTINARDWNDLPQFLAREVNHNARTLDKDGYIALIPAETHFVVADLVVDPETRQVASRLEITVAGEQRTEHCFYQFTGSLVIEKVWSLVVDGEATGAHGN